MDACVRCAEPTEDSYSPTALFREGYVCPKCQTATNRRDAYLDTCAIVEIKTVAPEVAPAPTEPAATEPVETTEPAPTEVPATESDIEETMPAEDQD